MEKKNLINVNDAKTDYGFTFTNEEELVANTAINSDVQEEIEDLKERLRTINSIFRPLLINLAKQPNKPFIKWPNRKEIIEEQLRKLETLTNV